MSCLRLPIPRLPHSFDDRKFGTKSAHFQFSPMWHGHEGEGDELLFIFCRTIQIRLSLFEAVSSVSRFYCISAAPQFQSTL